MAPQLHLLAAKTQWLSAGQPNLIPHQIATGRRLGHRMLDLNPDIHVQVYNEPFTSANAIGIAEDYDLIIDGTDNFPTRYLTNDLCVLTGKPNVYGSIFRFDGQVSVFDARYGPCYR